MDQKQNDFFMKSLSRYADKDYKNHLIKQHKVKSKVNSNYRKLNYRKYMLKKPNDELHLNSRIV